MNYHYTIEDDYCLIQIYCHFCNHDQIIVRTLRDYEEKSVNKNLL